MDVHAKAGITQVPTITTDRLILRTFRLDDAPVVADALNRWEVTQWLTQVPFPYAEEDFAWFIKEMCSYPDDLVWAMERGGEMIGTISLTAELGYWLHPAHHGVGLMFEAAKAVCAWHFATRDADLVSGYHLGNKASCNVLTKLGFANTHIDRDVQTARGDKVDIQRMILRKYEWAKGRA